MTSNKVNKFLLATSIISTLILVIGATFSYFTISTRSKLDAIAVEAGSIKLGIGVSNLTSGLRLIPMNDEDIMTAYKQNCIDDKGFGACNFFKFDVSNFSYKQDLIGEINFDVNNIENLRYIVLDENDNIYLEKTNVSNGKTTSLPLGEHFILNEGTEISPTMRTFKLVIWLTNLEEDQNDYDAGGTYSATVTYSSVNGDVLTGTIKGMK